MQTEMARMLAILNGGEVARRLGVTRTSVSEWARLPDPPPARVVQVRQLLLEALGRQETASPSDWGRRLREDAAAITDLLEELAQHRAAQAAVLAAASRLPADGSAEHRGAGGPSAPRRPHRQRR